jgi:hypothetical protein
VVPPYLRALFRRIGVPIRLRVELPEGTSGLPATMLALLKLSARGITLTPPEVVLVDAEAPPRVVLGHGDRILTLGPDELAAPGQPLARQIAEVLLGQAEAAEALERFAREAPRQDALRRLTRAMLATQSIDRLRYITLLGMTAGGLLGFSRAALLVYDEDSRTLVGTSAIGPYDDDEAQGIWDAIETLDKTLEEMIADYAASEVDSRFEEFVRTLECSLEDAAEGDEVQAALAASGPLRFVRDNPVNPVIAALAPPGRSSWCARSSCAASRSGWSSRTTATRWRRSTSARSTSSASCSTRRRWCLGEPAPARERGDAGAPRRADGAVQPARVRDADAGGAVAGAAAGVAVRAAAAGRRPLQGGQRHVRAQGRRRAAADGGGAAALDAAGARHRGALRRRRVRGAGDRHEHGAGAGDRAERIGVQALEQGISLSIGGAVWPRDNLDTSVLFAEADAQLYEAKHGGRCRACIEGISGGLVFELTSDS